MMPGNRAVMYAVLDSKPRAMIKRYIFRMSMDVYSLHTVPLFVLPCIVRNDGEAVYEKLRKLLRYLAFRLT